VVPVELRLFETINLLEDTVLVVVCIQIWFNIKKDSRSPDSGDPNK